MSNSDEPVEDEVLTGGNERRDIVLVDYDPSWPARFRDEWVKITTALGTEAIGIEHIGSTAVPGLAAKPIIDLLVTVADIEDELRYLPALQRVGYVLRVRERGHRMVRTPEFDVHVQSGPMATLPSQRTWPSAIGSAQAPRTATSTRRPSVASPSKTGRR